MKANEEISKWLSSFEEVNLNFDSAVTDDDPNFYRTNVNPISVNCGRKLPDYNLEGWEFVYVHSHKTRERLLKSLIPTQTQFFRAMERLVQTASPEEDSRRHVVNGPSNIYPISTGEIFVEQNQPPSSIRIGFVFHDAFPNSDKVLSKSIEEQQMNYDRIKDDLMKNCDIIISMSSFIKPESGNENQPNFMFAANEINQPKFQQMKDNIESFLLQSLCLEGFRSKETFSLETIQDNIMSTYADFFSKNVQSREYEAAAVASNFVMHRNQHFEKQIELLHKISKKQFNVRRKMDVFDKFPNSDKRVHNNSNLSTETQVRETSCLFLRKLIAYSLSNEELKENFEEVYGSEGDISQHKAQGQELSQNPLQAYYAIPCRETIPSRLYDTEFKFFTFYKSLKKATKEHQVKISCECDSDLCVPHQFWDLLHFFDSMGDDLESIQGFGFYGDKNAGTSTESNTIQNWNYLNWSFKADTLHKRCRENIQDEIKMKYSEQYQNYHKQGR